MKTAAVALSTVAASILMPAQAHADNGDDWGRGVNLVNVESRKCLEAENSGTANGTRVQQWDCNGQAGAVWTHYEEEGGGAYLYNVNAHKCLEIADSRGDNGAPAQLWDCIPGLRTQQWSQADLGATLGAHFINDNSLMELEIENGSHKNGARAQQWLPHNTSLSANWYIVYAN
ncbi:RICIN domain-containing protein [Kitasatospora cathayae]|uniref:RICIN domain-containing protein n=1 Tax=Kitasatospora cathayae TaxID=3004092 RepID=A0ABY7QGU2_9ACTN|nr:RICIN domain-containing protein [Kitasatospora sp. HUAS 3-15]WBP91940.1 RICIN domain-containing protein [Kitasatospora sp. HUAS 3-15]